MLLAAVELGLFDELARAPLGREALAQRLGIHDRGARDFFDALVALHLIARDPQGRYANSEQAGAYLRTHSGTSLRGVMEYLNARQYDGWGALAEALRTGTPQTGPFAAGGFADYYADPVALRVFLRAMTSGNHLPAQALAARFPWEDYASVIDIGCAEGCLPVHLACAHSHLVGGGFDLPAVGTAFVDYVASFGLENRLRFYAGDFLHEPLPRADVLTMSRVLHDWDVPTRKLIMRKAYEALPAGGALVVCETLIDDDRRTALHALLSSLNMLLQTTGGFESSGAQLSQWMAECGFQEVRILPLAEPYSAVVGTRP